MFVDFHVGLQPHAMVLSVVADWRIGDFCNGPIDHSILKIAHGRLVVERVTAHLCPFGTIFSNVFKFLICPNCRYDRTGRHILVSLGVCGS